ncbi:ATP-binding protein [Dokdonella sp.]|uniref:ATP-binding protein n=1 Tax=Dokdonella sp. TaxID=2291710 RepID=UPI001B065CA7|nr:ATP-binding protein [Dokdonella sp.]MBO9663846.1 HAMP domain-containing histidine kinase [Dokdonella sp.]
MNAPAANRHIASHHARELTETLAWLRLCAVSGQALTVAVVAFALDMPIPLLPLAGGIAALAAFGVFAFWRLRQPWPVSAAEAFGHIAVDIGVLAFLLYCSGGATNPFVSLLVMPIALAAAALPRKHVVAVALLAAAAYLALIPWHLSLPPLHTATSGNFNLHVAGTAINFGVTAGVLAFFISRLARALREREAEVQREHERALRDEGILAIATQAAGTAHELNTPLSTIRTLLAELRREHAQGPLAGDLDLLIGQAERCRDILRELVAVGRRQLAGTPQKLPLAEFVRDCESHFHLLRPEVELHTSIGDGAEVRIIEAAPNLRHAVINLLSNAADASLAAGSSEIELGVVAGRRVAELFVRDHGRSSGIAPGTGTAFQTSKQHGLGLGLALAHATAERLGGDLSAEALADGGWLQRLRVPLLAADNRRP